MAADADRVVTTIKKMKMLLRNVETQHEDIDLSQVSIFQVKSIAATGGVSICQSVLPGGCRIRGDAVQFQLAIANLVRNAVEALVAAGATVREVGVAGTQTDEPRDRRGSVHRRFSHSVRGRTGLHLGDPHSFLSFRAGGNSRPTACPRSGGALPDPRAPGVHPCLSSAVSLPLFGSASR